MDSASCRTVLGTGAATMFGTAIEAKAAESLPKPVEGDTGATDIGPRNLERERQNPTLLTPPSLVEAHLEVSDNTGVALRRVKSLVV